MKRSLRYGLEAVALSAVLRFFRLLPLDIASAMGGELGRAIGPFFPAHRTARQNLSMIFPEKKLKEINQLVGNMWEHLGRVAAEYSSLPGARLTSRVRMRGEEHLPKAGEAALFFSGHLGNWELLCSMAFDRGVDLAIVYRHINNPKVDDVIARLRGSHAGELIPKGQRGAVKILGALKRGASVAMLIDQKQNNGIAVPFLGRDAMTSPAIAEIALKYDIPIIPARVIRRKGAYFDGEIYPPLQIQKTGNHQEDVLRLMTQINALLADWVREHPEQWFWVHRRWPKTMVSYQM